MNNFSGEPNQTLVEHLSELRIRLMWSILGVFLGFLVCWGFSDFLFDIARGPISPYLKSTAGGLIFTAPMDKFLAHLKVAVLAGTLVSSPFWLYHVWKFVAPGLYEKEKKYAIAFVCFGTGLFMLGMCFVYFIVLPMAFKFLMTFGGNTDTPMITIGEYLSFFVTTTLVFGLAFEMPLILTILGIMGLVSSSFLNKYRRYSYVILAVASAVLTPPDALSMIMMLVPLILLYELSIILVKIFEKIPNSDPVTKT